MNLYVGHAIGVMLNGLFSDFFVGLNGIKQGNVANPVLFCLRQSFGKALKLWRWLLY